LRYKETEVERKIREEWFKNEVDKVKNEFTQKLMVAKKINDSVVNLEKSTKDNAIFEFLKQIEGFQWLDKCQANEIMMLEKIKNQINETTAKS